MCASLALPVHAADLRMGVSAVVLSHCSMRLTGSAINSIRTEPFTARCNSPMAPRVRSGSAVLAGPVLLDSLAALAASATTNGARAQSEVIGTTDDARRIVEYIQYTIEY